MNYSQAVQGQLTRSGAIRAIQSQAETELGRKLNPEESTSLWCTGSSPHAVLKQIQKVNYFTAFFIYNKGWTKKTVLTTFCILDCSAQ